LTVKGRRPKPVPQRTCIGCRSVQGKRELVRVVRTPEGETVVDPTGRRNGRGAYVHKSRECWDLALKRGALERALKVAIGPDVRRTLAEYGHELPSAPPEVTPAEPEDNSVVSESDTTVVAQAEKGE
jgi:uncharacterized protein